MVFDNFGGAYISLILVLLITALIDSDKSFPR